MRKLIIRSLNVLMIIALLMAYNSVITQRVHAEQKAKAEADAYNKKIMEENAQLIADAAPYIDGVYTADAVGFGGDIVVEVAISAGQLSDIRILSAEKEDAAYLSMAQEIIPAMIEAQSEDVDTISGATFTSTGIRDAVSAALTQAAK